MFENDFSLLNKVADLVIKYAQQIDVSLEKNGEVSPSHPDSSTSKDLNDWNPPAAEVFKINVDGCIKGNPGPVGFGGVCKDPLVDDASIFLGSWEDQQCLTLNCMQFVGP